MPASVPRQIVPTSVSARWAGRFVSVRSGCTLAMTGKPVKVTFSLSRSLWEVETLVTTRCSVLLKLIADSIMNIHQFHVNLSWLCFGSKHKESISPSFANSDLGRQHLNGPIARDFICIEPTFYRLVINYSSPNILPCFCYSNALTALQLAQLGSYWKMGLHNS